MRPDFWRCGLASATVSIPVPAFAATALPSQFAGEALTVALAFAFPALAAGAYLSVQRLRTKFGTRTLVLVGVLAGLATAFAVGIDDKTGWLQSAGLANL